MHSTEVLSRMRVPVSQRIPAGLLDGSVEIFYHDVDVYANFQSRCIVFIEWPEWLLSLLENDLRSHPLALTSLLELGITNRLEMIWQYARCRFGSFDGRPDIDEHGQINHTEYWDCGFRGACPFEGKLCSTIKTPNGYLTPRQIDVTRLVADDLMNKEIADILGISHKTVPVHIDGIIEKIGGKRRGDIIRFAVDYNITHNK